MRQIQRYPLPLVPGKFVVEGGPETEVLSVGLKAGEPMLWVLHDDDPSEAPIELNVHVEYTGEWVDWDAADLIGTIVINGGLVLHAFLERTTT